MKSMRILALSAVLVFGVAACNKEQPAPAPKPAPAPIATPPAAPAPAPAPVGVTVKGIQLGNAVGADKNVTAPMVSFGTKDTIYAAVSTDGTAPSATLAAKWTYQDGQTVNEATQTIAPNGPTVTEFHISKPDGWPTGSYTVAITLDGKPAGTSTFEVK